MPDILLRLSILILVGACGWLLVWVVRRFIEAQRSKVLHATPSLTGDESVSSPTSDDSISVRILAFSSPDCRQCHQLQTPALQRVLNARGEAVSVVEVDATTEHNLTQMYRVLTVPSTVILDQGGKARAVNYGFAPAQRLLNQIDEILAG